MDMQKLTIHHYAEDAKEERRVTLSPQQIVVVMAEVEDVVINGRSLRKVGVLFLDGGSIELNINHSDLSALETAIGSYCFE